VPINKTYAKENENLYAGIFANEENVELFWPF